MYRGRGSSIGTSSGESVGFSSSTNHENLNMEENGIFVIPLNSTLNVNLSTVLDEYRNNLFIYNEYSNIILIAVYIPLFIIALSANLLVILVVSRFRCLRSVTNYFLVNLSVADLLVTLICMPMAVGKSVHALWLYGELMCKLTHYLTGVAVGSSVFTITAMSVDRYLAIRHPMSRKIINRRTTRKLVMLLWVIAIIIFLPIAAIRKSKGFAIGTEEYLYCVEEWPDTWPARRTFGIFCFVFVYAVPGFIVVLAYSLMGLRLCSRYLLPEMMNGGDMDMGNELNHSDSINSTWQVSSAGGRLIRERRRVAKILLILALVFALCWLPYSVLSLILDLKSETREDPMMTSNHTSSSTWSAEAETSSGNYENDWQPSGPFFTSDQINPSFEDVLLPFAILLGHANSAINPLLYCLLSKNFRRSVTELIRNPAKLFRSTRQECKIRMNFRKELAPPSLEPPSSTHSRRNHHAPDPPVESSPQNSRSFRTEPGELCVAQLPIEMVDMTLERDRSGGGLTGNGTAGSTISTSGYSSIRQSPENGQSLSPFPSHYYPHSCTESGCFFPNKSLDLIPKSNGHCPLGKRNAINGSLELSDSLRKCRVPSTIREESDSLSYQSAKMHSPQRGLNGKK